jgi:hypothetical protein
MKNTKMAALFVNLRGEIGSLPNSPERTLALSNLAHCRTLVQAADDDAKHNPPGKVVVRNDEGRVIGLQG